MFQNKSYSKQAFGVPGEIAKAFHNNCNTESGYTVDEHVIPGCFVQLKTTDKNNETTVTEVIGATGQAITGIILGVCTNDHYVSSCGADAQHIYPKNDNISYLNDGAIFIENDGQIAKKGQYVFLKNDNGKVVFDDNSTKADHTYTGFRVLIGHDTADDGIICITTALGYITKTA
ncbi:TPA: hypothetical protein KLA94_001722 [Campylobacter jejuni]|nr:hypothetical protein [Campylobacter jejuni]